MKYWAVVYLVKLERYKYTISLHPLPSHLLWHLCHLLYRLLSDISICFHRPTSTNTNKSFETIWAVCSSATLLACVLYATGDWELYAIIINSELSHPPYTDTLMLKEGEPRFWCTLRNYSPVFVALTRIHRQNLEPIPSSTKEIWVIFTFIIRVSPDHPI